MLKCTSLQMSSNYENRTPQIMLCIFVVKYKVEFYIVGTEKFREQFSPGLVSEEDFLEEKEGI